MKNSISLLSVFSALLLLAACAKDDDSNFQPKGNYGNSNISATTTTVTSTQWTFTNNAYEHTITDSAITQSVVDKGAVMVYVSTNGNDYISLPFSYQGLEFGFLHRVGAVIISVTVNSGGLAPPNNCQFKVVVLQPAGKASNPDIHWENFNEVVNVLSQ